MNKFKMTPYPVKNMNKFKMTTHPVIVCHTEMK